MAPVRLRQWTDVLGAAGIPYSQVLTFPEVVEHLQAVFREMFPWMKHAAAGTHRATGSPIKMSETPGRPSSGAPLLGQDTLTVLKELLELTKPTVSCLTAEGVILQATPQQQSDSEFPPEVQ